MRVLSDPLKRKLWPDQLIGLHFLLSVCLSLRFVFPSFFLHICHYFVYVFFAFISLHLSHFNIYFVVFFLYLSYLSFCLLDWMLFHCLSLFFLAAMRTKNRAKMRLYHINENGGCFHWKNCSKEIATILSFS